MFNDGNINTKILLKCMEKLDKMINKKFLVYCEEGNYKKVKEYCYDYLHQIDLEKWLAVACKFGHIDTKEYLETLIDNQK